MAEAFALPTGRNGRVLAAGLAVLSVVVVWVGVVGPVTDWYASRAGVLEKLRARAAHEAAQISALPLLRKEAEAVSKTPTHAVLVGKTDAIAGAALQEQVQSMAGAVSAQLTSAETLPAEQVGAYRRIGVRVELNAQLPVVVQLLKSIEEAEPTMLVDDLRLTATPVAALGVPLPLDAAFTVYAFRVGTAKEDSQ